MKIRDVPIEDTYAEAFPAVASRLLITADDERWAREAAVSFTGFATSVIGCGCEAGIEGTAPAETPDGRPGIQVLIFGMSKKALHEQLVLRVGQSIMTCPTTACFNALEGETWFPVGGKLRFFGDGFQSSKRLEAAFDPDGGPARRLWRVPVMDGEFLIEHRFGIREAIAGGNFLILAAGRREALDAASAAVDAMRTLPGIILPFPGGVVRSGSKVGSRYRFMSASSNTAYCPTIRGQVKSALDEKTGAVLEIVIDGLTRDAVIAAMREGIRAACRPGVLGITAGNYGGKLGKHHFRLHELLGD